jgi:hypothetical protein
MQSLVGILVIVGAFCGASAVQAQQSRGPSQAHPMMAAMDSLDRRLDSLVDRMNRSSGTQQVAAMATVINELVAQRKGMHEHMQMMPGHMGQMRCGESRSRMGASTPRTDVEPVH